MPLPGQKKGPLRGGGLGRLGGLIEPLAQVSPG